MGSGSGEDVQEMVRLMLSMIKAPADDALYRLNSKINVREVSVNDLVTDLSDGVSTPRSTD